MFRHHGVLKGLLPASALLITAFLPLSQAQDPATPKIEYTEAFKQAYEEAVASFNRNSFEEALTKLDEAEKAQPGVPQTMNLRGAVLVRMKRLDEAAETFKKMTEITPGDAIPVFNLAECYFLKKDYTSSKQYFQKFLSMDDNASNTLGLYKAYLCDLMMGNKAEVDKTLRRAVPDRDDPYYYFVHSAYEFKNGNDQKAREYLVSAFNIYPGGMNAAFADSFIELGWVSQDEVGQIGAVDAAALKSLSQRPVPAQESTTSGKRLEDLLPAFGEDAKEKENP